MRATFVPAARTPLTFEDAAACMNTALASVLRATPSTTVLALALAKTALETGRWSAIWNGNWGNVKSSESYEGLFTCITLNEVLGGLTVVWFAPEGQLNRKGGEVIGTHWDVPPGHPQTRMRAFEDAQAGAHEYVNFVASGRYRDAWAELLEGDPVGYVHALKQKGYFTADEATYAKGVRSLHAEFVARLANRPAPEFPVPEHHEIRGLLAPQPYNADAVLSWSRTETDAFDALNASRNAQLFGDPNELQDPDNDEITKDENPRGNA